MSGTRASGMRRFYGAELPRAFEGAAEGPGWGWLGAGLSASSEVCVTCWTLAGLEPVETS